MAFYMDILAPIIEEYPMMYAKYVEDANYVEEDSPISFLELAMDYEYHIKKMGTWSRLIFIYWSILYSETPSGASSTKTIGSMWNNPKVEILETY